MPDTLDMLEEQGNRTASMPRMKGKLRIFLGYAPGIGKTYAMLEAAQRLHADGVDVVVAHVAIHNSSETALLLQGMEQIPARDSSEQSINVDAVLKRQPRVALVDDLAHNNLPDSRHPRRYQDVEELLNAGIDVFTTLNVYHIESLNDVIAQITGITFHETIPDRLLEQAQQIELIDLLPEDLLRRLEAGEIYPPAQIASARQTFFRMGNLIALRELAMRQVAAHVDEAMRSYMRSRDITGPWAARERILVAISSSPISQRLLRTACRLAQQTHADWYAIHIETPHQSPMDEKNQSRLNETMWLAESLGASVMSITGQSVGDEVLRFARENNITKIIVGQTLRSRWQEFWRGSIINEIIRCSGLIDVYVINSGETAVQHNNVRSVSQGHDIKAYLFALFTIALATLVSSFIHLLFPLTPENMVMFYLLAVVITALRSGFGPAVMASILSVLVFNFFFVPPQFTFRVADAQYIVTFSALLATGVVISNLTGRARSQTEMARRREQQTARLYAFSRDLSATVDAEDMMQTVLHHVKQTLHCEICLFITQKGHLEQSLSTDNASISEAELAVAHWAFEQGQSAGAGTNTSASAQRLYIPLKTAQSTIGVMGLQLEQSLLPEQQRLVEAFAVQAALAIEASQLAEQAKQAELLREKEKLQTIVLNSISHDLRTPLVSITGTLGSLKEDDGQLSQAVRHDLLEGAYEEADRLNRLVGNLLEMSRLQAGSYKLKRELYDVHEIISVARGQLENVLKNHQIRVEVEPDLPLISVDLVLIAQVMVNLLDNASKYSQAGTTIEITASHVTNCVQIEVADSGVGIPPEQLPHIFKKFYRATTANGRGGSGLGLSICEGIVELHQGNIQVSNRQGGGTSFIIQLPVIPEKVGLNEQN